MTLTMAAREQTRARHPDEEGWAERDGVRLTWCDLGEALILAAEHPERVAGLVFIGPSLRLDEADHGVYPFDADPGTDEDSTKQIEDCVGWAGDTDMETILDGFRGWETKIIDPVEVAALCPRVRCPALVIHGTEDAQVEPSVGAALAAELGGRLVLLEGAGHAPHARDPVKVNTMVADFAGLGRPGPAHLDPGPAPAQAGPVPVLAHPAGPRPPGCGHRPGAAGPGPGPGDRLAGPGPGHPGPGGRGRADPPGQRLAGQRVDPHRARVGRARPARLPGDQADGRDPGRQLHGLPRRRQRAAVRPVGRGRGLRAGLLPAREPRGEAGRLRLADRLRRLAANARRGRPRGVPDRRLQRRDDRAHRPLPAATRPGRVRRQPRRHRPRPVRPRAAADPRVGRGPLRLRRLRHRFDPAGLGDREELRRRLGYRPDEQVCVVTVGGSGVGGHLLRKVIAAYPEARRLVPGLRMVVVAGPRIDPESLPAHEGLEVHAYVHGLYQHLAASDLAVVQGGLTTCMELTAAGRPFLYFPLAHHFEQNFHVHHRLRQYNAGRRMEFATATPEVIAAAIADEIGRPVDYRPVETDGAARAARLLAELL